MKKLLVLLISVFFWAGCNEEQGKDQVNVFEAIRNNQLQAYNNWGQIYNGYGQASIPSQQQRITDEQQQQLQQQRIEQSLRRIEESNMTLYGKPLYKKW